MLAFVVVGIIIFLTISYFFLMFLFPEWVGISGEDTQKVLQAHKEEKSLDPQDEDIEKANSLPSEKN